MNYVPIILDLFRRKKGFTELLFAPNKPPMERLKDKLVPLADVPLTPADTRETLNSLRERSKTFRGPLEREGFFSFGLEEIGRIRVGYVTQRGSYMFSVVNVPFEIPEITAITDNDAESISGLINLVENAKGKVIYIVGENFMLHNTFAFSLLKRLSLLKQEFIYILERPITYLLNHNNSVVVQRELNIDVDTFHQGIEEALLLDPDIVYVSDIAFKDREMMTSVVKLMPFPFTLIVSQTLPDAKALSTSIDILLGDSADIYKSFVTKVIELTELENNRVRFSLTSI